MQTEQELRSKIMRRVYGVYVLRQLTSPMARFIALAVLFFAVASSVSLPHVFANALHVSSIPGFVNFWAVALASTTLVVQLCSVLVVAVIVWTLRDLVSQKGTHAQLSTY